MIQHNIFDLHSHTTHSDGQLSTIDLLKKAQEKNIQLFSITDHNSVGAYFDINNLNLQNHFSGRILTGCEMDTTFDGKAIEILAYGVDVEKLNNHLQQTTSFEWIKNKRDTVLEMLKENAKKIGATFDPNFKMIDYNKGESGTFIRHLKQFPENKKFFSDEVWNNRTLFFRKEVTNKNSPFFVDYSKFYKTPKQVVDIIHSCGGKAFLAHFFVYGFDNPKQTLQEFVKVSGVDGIECFYPTFKKDEVDFLVNYCNENNLLMSAGSDFHGSMRPQSKLGIPHSEVSPDPSILHWVENLMQD